MANLTSVGVTNGIPTSGTGTVSTIDAALAVLPTALGSNGGLKIDNTGATTPLLARIYDGTNGASIRGTNSPANAGDPALVVTLSPNSPVVGTATTSAPTYGNNTPQPLSLDANGNLRVTGGTSGSVAQGSTTAGQTGNLIQGAVTTAAPSYTTAQTSPLSLDTSGNLRVNVVAGGAGGGIVTQATAGNLNATVVGTGTFSMQNTKNTQINTGDSDSGIGTGGSHTQRVAIDTAQIGSLGKQNDAGSTSIVYSSGSTLPGRAHTVQPTAVADAAQTEILTDKLGKLVVVPAIRDLVVSSGVVTLTSTTETTLKAAVPSTFLDMTDIKLVNTSATAVRCDIRDTTGGTVIDTFYLPAGDTRGQTYQVPRKQTTVNTNWTVQLSGAVTDVRIVAYFIQNI